MAPLHSMEGVISNPDHLSIEELCTCDEVYNQELSWLMFNWRVLSMAGDVSAVAC